MHGYRRGLSLQITSEPAAEPITAQDVQRAGIDGSPATIEAFITASRQKVEAYLDRALITQSLRVVMNGFPYGAFWLGGAGFIKLPRAPLQSVESVKYFDIDDEEQTFASGKYLVLTDYTPGLIQVKYGETWPTDTRAESVVQVNYTAGYGDDAEDVPQAIREALILETAEHYRMRASTGVSSESIDNASRSYVDESTRMKATFGTGFSPEVLSLLEPYRVVEL